MRFIIIQNKYALVTIMIGRGWRGRMVMMGNNKVIYKKNKEVSLGPRLDLRFDEVSWVLIIPTPRSSPRGYRREYPARTF